MILGTDLALHTVVMVTTTPRWEWRTFGTTFGGADKCIGNVASTSRATRDTYLLCDAFDAIVAVRDQELDVKAPIRTDGHGLELWSPTFASTFPLEDGAVATIFALWNLPIPRLSQTTYDRDAFLSGIVAPHAALTPVCVVKQRQEGLLDGCHVEVTDVWFEGYPLRTLAIEMEDPWDVWQMVRALGLSKRENVNYVKALRHHLAVRGSRRGRAENGQLNRGPKLDARSYV